MHYKRRVHKFPCNAATVEFGIFMPPMHPTCEDPTLLIPGFAVIGTPDDAIEQIERITETTGGFGTFLNLVGNWADSQPTKRSYELIARYVIPAINGVNRNQLESEKFLRDNHDKFQAQVKAVVGANINEYISQKGYANIAPALQVYFQPTRRANSPNLAT